MARHVEKYIHDGMPVAHYHYPSYQDGLEQSTPDYNEKVRKFIVSYVPYNVSWWGIPGGYNQVMKNLKEGWKEGLQIMENHLKEMELPRTKSAKRKKIRSNQGNELDIHRVLNGNLDSAWSSMVKVESFSHRKRGKRVCVIVETSVSHHVDSQNVFWRGASAVMLVKSLLKKGYSVELNLANTVEKYGQVRINTVCAKKFQEKIDLELIAALTSVGFTRGPLFEIACKTEEKVPTTLGTPIKHEIPMPYFSNRANMVIRVGNILSKAQALEFAKNIAN